MSEYRVELEAFAGPLDLLLMLVKRHEIDLHDIPMATLTDQYLQHLEQMRQIDIHFAGEFLVMAASLLEIKSQMLAMQQQSDEDQSEPDEDVAGLRPTDPRYELVQQLLAYKQYKDAATDLELRREDWQSRFPHRPARVKLPQEHADASPDEDEGEAAVRDVELDELDLMDLCQAFARIMESVGSMSLEHEVMYDDTPISLHAEDVVDLLRRQDAQRMTLSQVFEGRRSRGEMVGLFLALLELVRQKRVQVVQGDDLGEIDLVLSSEDELAEGSDADSAIDSQSAPQDADHGNDAEAADASEEADASPSDQAPSKQDDTLERWRDPETGEIEYDWPDPDAKERAERRARLRAKRQAGPPSQDDEQAVDQDMVSELKDQQDAAFDEQLDEPNDLDEADDLDEDENDDLDEADDLDEDENDDLDEADELSDEDEPDESRGPSESA